MTNFILNLQLFAEAGNVVNTLTNGYVNAYTGASVSADGNSLTGELKTFYDTELLENARVEMFYAQFAKKQHLPKNHGTTVEWRKWNTFAKAGMLQEGVIPTGQKFGMSSKTGAINQYGTYAAVTDKLELRAYDDVILGASVNDLLNDFVGRGRGRALELDNENSSEVLIIEMKLASLNVNITGKNIIENYILDKVATVIFFIIILFDC